jgi:hypothetical protein
MKNLMNDWLAPIEDRSVTQFWLRLIWVAMQLIAVYFFISNDDPFFYQGF